MEDLKKTREMLGISLEELAEKTGLSVLGIKKIENGLVNNPYDAIRNKIELALNRRVNWLLTCKKVKHKKTTWYECERNFRKAIQEINGLDIEERSRFLNVFSTYVNTSYFLLKDSPDIIKKEITIFCKGCQKRILEKDFEEHQKKEKEKIKKAYLRLALKDTQNTPE